LPKNRTCTETAHTSATNVTRTRTQLVLMSMVAIGIRANSCLLYNPHAGKPWKIWWMTSRKIYKRRM